MADIIGSVVTGLCTGVGVYLANYLGEKHIRSKLDKVNDGLTEIRKLVKGEKNDRG